MAREKFGNTWWGEQWLMALSNIDDANRIPRGVRYARNGSVLEIDFDNSEAKAVVAGSRPNPYEVVLSMGAISQSAMAAVITAAKKKPMAIIKLLNGKMDVAMVDIMRAQGIQLFPQQARDMQMRCSCPDWAVPCKHIAAVLYVVCREIDNDPFTLFKFRGVDLPRILADMGISAEEEVVSIATMQDVVDQHVPIVVPERAGTIDFARLRDRRDDLLHLLADRPAFYPSQDFKTIYKSRLMATSKVAADLLLGRYKMTDLYRSKTVVDSLDYATTASLHLDGHTLVLRGATWPQIYGLATEDLHLFAVHVQHLHTLLYAALHLITKGLVIPTVVRSDKQRYRMLWQPCTLDPQVSGLVHALEGTIPIYDDDTRYATSLALTMLITDVIQHVSSNRDLEEDITALFFTERGYRCTDEGAIYPISVARWLGLYAFDLGDYYPILRVEEVDEGHFVVHVEVGVKGEAATDAVRFADFAGRASDDAMLYDIYRDLELLSHFLHQIDAYVNNGGRIPMQYDDATLIDFMFRVRPIMDLLGVQVLLPKVLKDIVRPRVSASVQAGSENESSGLLSLGGLLEFDWKVSVGDRLVDQETFDRLLAKADRLVKYKGAYLYVDSADIDRIRKQLGQTLALTGMDKIRLLLAEEYEGTALTLSDSVRERLTDLMAIDLVEQPTILQATLRPYQHRGYSWLVKNWQLGIGSIIADDMGLGKTLQVIALLCNRIEAGLDGDRVLIIVPTSLLPNWQAEFVKFAPKVQIYTHYGPTRDISSIGEEAVVLTTYGTARSDASALKLLPWAVTIIDEAQNIKNPNSQQSKAIKSIKAKHHIAMSGTPVENGLMDYWSIMDFTNKGLLYNKTKFKKEIANPITKNRDQQVVDYFTRITAPFLLRRMKTDKTIISDLPDKVVQDSYCSLTTDQAALYQSTLDAAMRLIEDVEEEGASSAFKRQGLVLQMILSLKQICNHPAQWLKDGDTRPDRSGKLQFLLSTLETILANGDKVLIFTQFREMGDIIQTAIQQTYGLNALWLHGGVSITKRAQMVEHFQLEAHHKIMILSLKAGGTGLNLTAANHVIHYDLWWNPAVEAQATDRAFRIGQQKNVFVHRLITQDTFEEKINKLIQSKQSLAQLTVGSGEKWIGQLTTEELQDLFGRE